VELNVDTLLAIARMRDPFGVLSIYVDADPSEKTRERPTWQLVIKNELDALRERINTEASRERRTAFFARLDDLAPDFAWLLDPKTKGRGRALWAAIGNASVERLSVQLPFPNRVTLEETAHVRPLLTMLDDAQPVGVLLVSKSGARLAEWKLGRVEELARWAFAADADEWRMMKYVSGATPAQVTTSLTDKLKKRLGVHRRRFFEPVAEAVEDLAHARHWGRLLLAGDPRITEEFAQALPVADSRRQLLFTERLLDDLDGPALSEAIIGEIAKAKRQAELDLVLRARDAALAGGAGSLGLADTLAALMEGRVYRLLLDSGREWSGAVAPDGRLLDSGEKPPDVRADQLTPEPFLAERMIEQAIRTSASVVPVEGKAAAALADADGVAAILRW